MAAADETTEQCMVDTNILVYATVSSAPKHREARAWMTYLQRAGIQLCVSFQIYREYLAVLTRSAVFELVFSPEEALDTLEAIRPAFIELGEVDESSKYLFELIRRHRIRGKQIHDANIVATMLSHGIEHLATYNTADFRRFGEIKLLSHPSELSNEL